MDRGSGGATAMQVSGLVRESWCRALTCAVILQLAAALKSLQEHPSEMKFESTDVIKTLTFDKVGRVLSKTSLFVQLIKSYTRP